MDDDQQQPGTEQAGGAPTSSGTTDGETTGSGNGGDGSEPTGTGAVEGAAAAVPAAPPRPGPRPGARPGPRPGAGPAAAPTPVPVPPSTPASDPSRWGRVDDDGAVWLTTADGERQVGSWQAGEPAAGLAHFGRRFDDLATEVGLLELRLSSGAGDARSTRSAAQALLDSLPTASVVGDVEGLGARLTAVLAAATEAAGRAKAEKDAAKVALAARKEALAAEAEQLAAGATQWKAAGDRLREILEEWKTIRGLDRKVDDALWKRYSRAREDFTRRRGAHFAELDRERAGSRHRKEELVEAAEALATSTDWGPTAGRFRELMAEWKTTGRAPRDADEALWTRFKAAQDTFFGARNAAAAERDGELAANATAKEALLVEAEALDPAADLERARTALRSLAERWDAAGKVPRERMAELDGRMRAVETRVREAVDAQWRRTDPEALARAAQFTARVDQYEEQARKARAAGDERRAAAADAQAAQWREWATAAAGAVGER